MVFQASLGGSDVDRAMFTTTVSGPVEASCLILFLLKAIVDIHQLDDPVLDMQRCFYRNIFFSESIYQRPRCWIKSFLQGPLENECHAYESLHQAGLLVAVQYLRRLQHGKTSTHDRELL